MQHLKKSVKALPKSMRERKRYVLFELDSPGIVIGEKELRSALDNIFLSLYGSIGSAEINARLVKFYPEKKEGIICCARGSEAKVRVALLFLREGKKGIRVRSLRCSGSMKRLQQSL